MRIRLLSSLLLLYATSALADSTVFGGSLLTPAHANQLADWLGQGDLVLTLIYDRGANPDGVGGAAYDFHLAADGQGPTFSILMTNLGLVGGYNPASWNGGYNYTLTPISSDRTAFIFNLDANKVYRQRPAGVSGQYQTYNGATDGPTFGSGYDLSASLLDLSRGMAIPSSYGNGSENVFGLASTDQYDIYDVEVYTFAAAGTPAVPEPATGLLGLTALCVLAGLRRRAIARNPSA